ncbi:MAG: TrkA family potassium uptake protein [Planctomycetota bacterium]
MLKNLTIWLLASVGALMLVLVILLMVDARKPLDDAVFTSLSLLVQGEPMDLDPKTLGVHDKFIIGLVMIGGTVLMAVIFALVTDKVLSFRLDYLLGKRGIPVMKDHIILIGLGSVGLRTWQALKKFPGEYPILVIDRDSDNRRLEEVRRAGDTVIVDDPRMDGVLDKAGVKAARTLICTTNDDLANLEFALTAREMNPGIRIVLRMYDQKLAKKVGAGFDIHVAFSSSALAAPAFAAAAYDRSIINSYYLGSYQVVTAEVAVGEGSKISSMTTRAVERDYTCAVLKMVSAEGEGELYPHDDKPIVSGTKLLVSCTYPTLKKIKADAGDTWA